MPRRSHNHSYPDPQDQQSSEVLRHHIPSFRDAHVVEPALALRSPADNHAHSYPYDTSPMRTCTAIVCLPSRSRSTATSHGDDHCSGTDARWWLDRFARRVLTAAIEGVERFLTCGLLADRGWIRLQQSVAAAIIHKHHRAPGRPRTPFYQDYTPSHCRRALLRPAPAHSHHTVYQRPSVQESSRGYRTVFRALAASRRDQHESADTPLGRTALQTRIFGGGQCHSAATPTSAALAWKFASAGLSRPRQYDFIYRCG